MITSQGYMLLDTTGLPIMNLPWASQSRWAIDRFQGNDANSGLDQAPLKTWGELRRRMKAVGGHTTAGTTITLLTDLEDDLILDWGTRNNIDVHIQGVPTTIRSGIFSSVNSRNSNATNTVTDSSVSSWSADIGAESGHLLIPTSGNAQDFPAWITKDLGNHQARVTSYVRIDDLTEQNPSNGDNYEIVSMPFVQNYYIAPPTGFFFFKYLNLGDANSSQWDVLPNPLGAQFTYCSIYNLTTSNTSLFLVNCCIKTAIRLFTGTIESFAGYETNYSASPFAFSDGEIETAGEHFCDLGFLIQGIRKNVINMGYLRSVDVLIMDSPDHGITVGTGGIIRITKLSGTGNGGFGLSMAHSGTVFAFLVNCSVTGNSGDVDFCGTTKTWSELQSLGYLKSSNSFASIGPL